MLEGGNGAEQVRPQWAIGSERDSRPRVSPPALCIYRRLWGRAARWSRSPSHPILLSSPSGCVVSMRPPKERLHVIEIMRGVHVLWQSHRPGLHGELEK